MKINPNILQVLSILLFIILMIFGILFLLAAPVNPATAFSRIITGIILIIVAIALLVITSLLIQKSKIKVVKITHTDKGSVKIEQKVPLEIICKSCSNPIEISEELSKKNEIICEKCGELIKIPKDNVRW
ncbi:MAG: hypothetical protein ACTSR8_00890 [Promethearchaeota archaeon]